MIDNRQLVHDLLGHVTTIKAAVYETTRLPNLPAEAGEYLQVALDRLDKLVSQIEDVRSE